ncbi:TetR/AcrR family transcriptional regulator [Actinomycetospora chiangmaiensis]|uniref:TetR/AcrR family transcriptional regulator n=1 Tax=Actinomycetospora chiangmaiensis TaxID=402650 RepID=UPI00052542CD|nr:TetR/AcrR family transcriptional regulator [Actinomycetospora chiangmaiensis]
MPGGPRQRGRYHHGDLPSALLDAGLEQLATTGPARFSVAEVARRVGVSTAAPYRHFTDRDGFLAAVAARAADRLATALAAAADGEDDPRDRLAAAAGAYAAFVAEQRLGIDVIFSPALRGARDADLAAAGRAVMGRFLEPAREIAGDDALELTEQVVALAHGYATLDADGFLTADRVTDAPTADRARRAARALIDGVAGR